MLSRQSLKIKKKKNQTEGLSKPSITPFQSEGLEVPDKQSKEKQNEKKEKPKEKSRKIEDKKESFKEKENVSCCVIYFMYISYLIIVCYVCFNDVSCSFMLCFYCRFLMSTSMRIDLKKSSPIFLI